MANQCKFVNAYCLTSPSTFVLCSIVLQGQLLNTAFLPAIAYEAALDAQH